MGIKVLPLRIGMFGIGEHASGFLENIQEFYFGIILEHFFQEELQCLLLTAADCLRLLVLAK